MIYLYYISIYSILLPCGMAFFNIRKNGFNRSLFSLAFLVFFILAINLINLYYLSIPVKDSVEKNNMFLFHIYTLIEGVLLVYYYSLFFESMKIKLLLMIFSVGFLSICLIDIFMWDTIKSYPSIPRTIECVLIILVSIFFYMNLFHKSEIVDLIYYPHFWMVSGYLLFFAGTFFMNIVGKLVNEKNPLGFDLYVIYYYLNIFLNIIYTITLWLGSRRLVLAR